MNLKDRSQKFFLKHNDDVTCIGIDNRKNSYLVATGQTDPKDIGEKDEPKIWIWDWRTGDPVCLIDSAHWGSVLRTQFSYHNDYLFSIGGGEEHPLAVWDISPKVLEGHKGHVKLIDQPTTKEDILGFVVSPIQHSGDVVEELIIFGKKKCMYITLKRVPIKKKSKR